MMKSLLLMLALALPLIACSGEREDLKSPCVGASDSPCGPKRLVNQWWLA
ncbi:MAG: hypothetical protein K2Q12_06185 [Rickettsiales bacterium]|nr:hypothetical protein [Rickettsiales bacterium]